VSSSEHIKVSQHVASELITQRRKVS